VQQVDPPVQIDPSVRATYEAAHIQAEAAVRAAEIGAKAAWDAAVLQISAAIIAAVAALIAGRWAYQAALRAAKNQTQLENDKHNAKVAAYSIRQNALINNIITEIDKEIFSVGVIIEYIVNEDYFSLKENKEIYLKVMSIYVMPDDWKDEQWENHALLGNTFVESLLDVIERYSMLNNIKEILIKNVANGFQKSHEKPHEFYGFVDLRIDNPLGKGKVEVLDLLNGFKSYKTSLLYFKYSFSDLLKAIPDTGRRAGVTRETIEDLR
jgi:hypothetical protein